MDKVGHFYTTYQMGYLMMEAFDWAGYSKNQKTVYRWYHWPWLHDSD